MSSCEYR